MKTFISLVVFSMLVGCGAASSSSADAGVFASGGFDIVVTGESFATQGYAFPPLNADDLYFQDGWQIRYESVVVFFGGVQISENPDRSPTDQSQTGDLVAEAAGPWVVDLAKAGPLDSAEQNGKAWPVTTLANQNKRGNAAFDPTQKYAFGFDLLAASAGATKVNAVDDATIAMMTARGFTLVLKGTAEFKGSRCRSTVASYDFKRLPLTVHFSFGFKTPTTFKNCINPLLMPEDSRGIQSQRNVNTRAQVTFHLDHPLWESLTEDAPLRFDLVAARGSVDAGVAQPTAVTLTQDDLVGVGFQAGKDTQGVDLPWRYCGPIAATDRLSGTVSYGTAGVPVTVVTGDPSAGLRDLLDFMSYNQSTFGHLNNDGLCFPVRHFPAP